MSNSKREETVGAYLAAGDIAFDRGDFNAAVVSYKTALGLRPDDPVATCNLARALEKAGRTAEAVIVLEGILSRWPGIGQAAYGLALIHESEHRFDAAIEAYWRAIVATPDLTPAFLGLGSLLRRLGRPAEAISCLERLTRMAPDDPDHLGELGAALRDADRLEYAAQVYRQALDLRPGWAAALFNLGIVQLRRRAFVEALEAFDSLLLHEPERVEAHLNRGVALRGLGREQAAVESYLRALALRPDYLKCRTNLGDSYLSLGRFAEAIEQYEQVLRAAPEDFDAINHLGIALTSAGRSHEAVRQLEHAVAVRPSDPIGHTHLGTALLRAGRAGDALGHYRKAVELDPASAISWCNLGAGLHDVGSLEDAVTCFEQAIAIDPQFAPAHTNLGIIDLLRGDLATGWPRYEWRTRGGEGRQYTVHGPEWDGSDLAGGTLMLHSEQGLGDTIQFLRFIPEVAGRCGRLILAVQESLRALASASFPDVEVVAIGPSLPGYDCRLSLMSLPAVLGTTLDTVPAAVPYLTARPEGAGRWGAQLPDVRRPRVGLVWAGGAAYSNDRNRSVGFVTVHPLLEIEGVDFVSLQAEIADQDRHAVAAACRLIRLGEAVTDFMDTAHIIDGLDLVISVDTAVAHLAGALACPVWILLPHVPDWRWLLDRPDSPWYPTARLFRRASSEDWSTVIKRIHDVLEAWLKEWRPPAEDPAAGLRTRLRKNDRH